MPVVHVQTLKKLVNVSVYYSDVGM